MFVLVLLTPGADKGLAVAQLVALLPITFMGPTFLQYLLLKFQDQAAAANLDPLTGLNNRRGLDERLAGYLADATQVSVMVIDIDRFKAINDRYGHHVGDSVLAMTARRLSVGGVLVARTGGEEFAVVTDLGEPEVTALAEQLRDRVHSTDDLAPTTVSIGVAHRHCDFRAESSADIIVAIAAVLRRADVAMYQAKGLGGNMVVAAADDGRSPRTVL
ncbi:MAG: GGDEF domain-containing protein [Rhodococcus sp. (in: high G+C Gram-positive bacteria)]